MGEALLAWALKRTIAEFFLMILRKRIKLNFLLWVMNLKLERLCTKDSCGLPIVKKPITHFIGQKSGLGYNLLEDEEVRSLIS